MNIPYLDFPNASFKDYEYIPGQNFYQWARHFAAYVDNWRSRGHWNYRQECLSGCGSEVLLNLDGKGPKNYVAMVFSDYLGHAIHPKVIAKGVEYMQKYGMGVAASPAIGGHMDFHRELEEKTAAFFRRQAAILFTTGYTANTATIMALLKGDRAIAIVDASIHASMYEGIRGIKYVPFYHNNMESLERKLKENCGRYDTMMVIVDGVYSQPADICPLKDVVFLCKKYGAKLAMDDAHGVGVLGETGRGVIELYDAWQDVDVITGTFSKTFGHVGGYVVGDEELITYLKYQAGQHIFSVAPTPAAACLLKSIDLIDEEPQNRLKLWVNIRHLKDGLHSMGFDTGTSASAIVPVKTGNAAMNAEICKWLLYAGVYTNQIGYPAVPKKHAVIRQSVMATHDIPQMDRVLEGWAYVKKKLGTNNCK
ncbi:aminotransferase class I/II-fold pyridoxal phosphate-dependent enzyme [Pedobacter africanus]|uniref:Glycine C-acetyltransferase n=1 Tax=Pedobacter africanus TaxID=151894 RepID=A0A1W1Z632_9SPHI|nr:aminotransferase class I/II-fold pyridoxal phosphate-dependent enzyme [Pedobacter africanus]SMC43899.1 glycine C-acetyltransferase [Pedobacter africanus]